MTETTEIKNTPPDNTGNQVKTENETETHSRASIQTPEQKAPESKFFDTKTDKLNDFLKEKMDAPRDQFHAQTPPPDEKEKGSETEPGKPESDIDPTEKARKMGKMLFLLFDYPLTFGAAVISGEERSRFKITPEEKKELIEAWADISDAYDWKKPPAWLVISIFMGIAYGSMYYEAVKIAREKEKGKKEMAKKRRTQYYQEPEGAHPPKPQQPQTIKKPEIEDAEIVEDEEGTYNQKDFTIPDYSHGRPSKRVIELTRKLENLAHKSGYSIKREGKN